MSAPPDTRPGGLVTEARQILDAFERDLQLVDRDRARGEEAPDRINACFRAAHSLKGLAGLSGCTRMAAAARALERLLDRVRLGQVPLRDPVMESLHAAVAAIGAALTAGGDLEPGAEAALVGRMDALVEAADRPVEPAVVLPVSLRQVLTEFEEHRAQDNVRRGRRLYAVGRAFELATIERGLEELRRALAPLGEVIATVPGDAGDLERLYLQLLVGSDADAVALAAAAPDAEVIRVEAVLRSTGEGP